MEEVLFIFFALVALVSALLVITKRNPVISILFLILTFFSLALLYVMLGAQFIAAMQVIVYAGAIMVLFVFIVMMLNLNSPQKWDFTGSVRMWLGFATAAAVLLALASALKGALGIHSALDQSQGTISSVGDLLFKSYLLPFELASVLLLVAIIGVVTLIKRPTPKESSVVPGGEEQ